MDSQFEKVDNGFDPNARADAEKAVFEHLLAAMGLKDKQNAFLNQTAATLNSCSFLFGGNCGIDSPPRGIAEKLVVRFRYADRTMLEEAFDAMCNALPMRGNGGRIIYAGFRCENGYERPEVLDVAVDMGNGKTTTVWAADVELRAIFGLTRSGR